MIVDTSALIAVINNEESASHVIERLNKPADLHISAGTWLELFIVADNRYSPVFVGRLEDLLIDYEITIQPVTATQAAFARRAYRNFGKGRHPAQLNYGDCFSYALAKDRRESLLFVGSDFSQTDIESALST